MYLHLINTDLKFVSPITRMFEAAAPGLHEYVLVDAVAGAVDTSAWSLPDGVTHAPDGLAAQAIVARRDDWDGVLLHGIPFSLARPILQALDPRVAVAWYVWGFEAYEVWPVLREHLFLPKTRAAAIRLSGPPGAWFVRKAVRALRRDDFRDVLDRYDYCVTQVREEYELFVECGLLRNTKYAWGSVGTLEDWVAVNAPACSGPDIQVGNSATLTNNHLDAFDALARMDLDESQVVVPLSYGDSRYRDIVTNEGRRLLGDRFRPLETFLPLDEYCRVTSRCGHVVMNHCRQQALGNIIDALWRGARIYMNDTPAFRGLRRLGFDIGLMSETLGRGRLLEPMIDHGVQVHRQRLVDHLGRERVTAETARLLGALRAGRPGSSAGV